MHPEEKPTRPRLHLYSEDETDLSFIDSDDDGMPRKQYVYNQYSSSSDEMEANYDEIQAEDRKTEIIARREDAE